MEIHWKYTYTFGRAANSGLSGIELCFEELCVNRRETGEKPRGILLRT